VLIPSARRAQQLSPRRTHEGRSYRLSSNQGVLPLNHGGEVPGTSPRDRLRRSGRIRVAPRAHRRPRGRCADLPQYGRIVLVVLQDGRQLEGELMLLTDRFEVAGTVFESWEIDELGDE
jgi:hypothetical protein